MSFIERHGLWSDERRRQAAALREAAHRDGVRRIAIKQVNLIDCDRSLRNPSLIL
jgi:hypothetical protein